MLDKDYTLEESVKLAERVRQDLTVIRTAVAPPGHFNAPAVAPLMSQLKAYVNSLFRQRDSRHVAGNTSISRDSVLQMLDAEIQRLKTFIRAGWELVTERGGSEEATELARQKLVPIALTLGYLLAQEPLKSAAPDWSPTPTDAKFSC